MRINVRLPFLLAIALCTPACFPALLGIGAGVVISHEVLENSTYVAQISENSALTWVIAKSSMTNQASAPITVNDDLRTATGPIEDATVTVSVETFDDESCRLTVSARNAIGLSDGDAAKAVLHKILSDLNEACD